jgi:hypothetical protein
MDVQIDERQGIIIDVKSSENLAIEQDFFQEKKGMLEAITGDKVSLRIGHD